MFVDGVFEIWFAGVFAGVVTPNTFIGKGEIAICASDGEGITLEKFARIG